MLQQDGLPWENYAMKLFEVGLLWKVTSDHCQIAQNF
jgi:hypothetical protein